MSPSELCNNNGTMTQKTEKEEKKTCQCVSETEHKNKKRCKKSVFFINFTYVNCFDRRFIDLSEMLLNGFELIKLLEWPESLVSQWEMLCFRRQDGGRRWRQEKKIEEENVGETRTKQKDHVWEEASSYSSSSSSSSFSCSHSCFFWEQLCFCLSHCLASIKTTAFKVVSGFPQHEHTSHQKIKWTKKDKNLKIFIIFSNPHHFQSYWSEIYSSPPK